MSRFFQFLVFDWFSPQTIEFSPLNTEDFQAFPHSANSTKKSESRNKFSLERFSNKNVKEEGTALTPKNKVSNIATLFLVSKTCVLNSHIREKLADQGRLTKGTPPRSTPYYSTNQFLRTTIAKFWIFTSKKIFFPLLVENLKQNLRLEFWIRTKLIFPNFSEFEQGKHHAQRLSLGNSNQF